ncbi:unnamed protein product [Periconia digitata]|uniref:JmjC domain-containing protein n=1 Tax=Periconia digitata TaxID=1303443 RepID=A0A9W4U2H1_9PLEO|nr:unnamed protein product [Periconia digitata]
MPALSRALASRISNCRPLSTKSTCNFRDAVTITGPKNGDNVGTEEPIIFKQWFQDMPATQKWFTPMKSDPSYHVLNLRYLEQFEGTSVPLELTRFDGTEQRPASFTRSEAPLSLLLMHMSSIEQSPSSTLYLAQCPLEDLPSTCQDDVPVPDLIRRIGRGDIYASSLWMGRAPTHTPLHRDPNPNLFVQLAGRKVVRLVKPAQGRQLYERSRVGQGHANMRGEEMMVGKEMEQLEHAVWGEGANDADAVNGVEAKLESGDALFIPLGWWHAVRGIGRGANASVNWWFR